jgi:phage-related baseplate assembly protein
VLRDDIRVLTDTVEVVPAVLIPVTVIARIWLYPDTPMVAFDAIGARFKEALAAHSGLGWDLTPSWVIGELQRPGVHKVELLVPTTDIRANANQAVRLIHLNLEFAGRDR